MAERARAGAGGVQADDRMARAAARAKEIAAVARLVEATLGMAEGEAKQERMRHVDALIDQMRWTPL